MSAAGRVAARLPLAFAAFARASLAGDGGVDSAEPPAVPPAPEARSEPDGGIRPAATEVVEPSPAAATGVVAPPPSADDAVGFDDVPRAAASAPAGPAPPAADDGPTWETKATLGFRGALWLERLNGDFASSARGTADVRSVYRSGEWVFGAGVHGEYDPVYTAFPSRFDSATRSEYERRLYPAESFVGWYGKNARVRVGRTAIAWGEGDVLSPLDIVSPRDLREPGIADLDGLRLPVALTEAGASWGYFRLDIVVVHEAHFGFRSPPAGPFTSFPRFAAAAGLEVPAVPPGVPFSYDHRQPLFDLDNQQFFARIARQGPGLDVALYAASALDQLGVVDAVRATIGGAVEAPVGEPPGAPDIALRALAARLDHRRFHLLGASTAVTSGSFLFKAEARAAIDLRFNTSPAPGRLSAEDFDVLGGMVGLTYSGIDNLVLALEVAKDFTLRDSRTVLFPVEQPSSALRARWLLLRQRLALEALGVAYGYRADYGGWIRVEGTYALTDGFSAGLGAISYLPSAELSPIAGFTRHDLLLVRFRADF